MSVNTGQNIQLFLAEGSATGLRIAEIKFRSERVTAAVRSDLAKQCKLDEVQRTGLYLLLGAPEDAAFERRVYIGESDLVSKRLGHHAGQGGKDWWEQTVTITSNDANLTKAHALYLESVLINRATDAKRAEVTNGQAPDRRHLLSRADRSDMDVFLENVLVILPLLGVEVFRSRPRVSRDSTPPPVDSPDESPVFQVGSKAGVLARGQEVDGAFVVQEGSTARPWTGVHGSYQALHERLVASGDLVPDGTDYRFARDVEFNSVSAAAAVIRGYPANGRKEWKRVDGGGTYAQWQDAVTSVEQPTTES